MRNILILIAIFTLSGCVTASESYLPDGSKGHLVTCGGKIFAFSDCLQKAGEICGASGYDVVTADGNASRHAWAAGGYSAGGGGFNAGSTDIVNRSLLIRCRQ